MEIYGKVGTHPQHRYVVKRLRKPPQVGQVIHVASVTDRLQTGRAAWPSLWRRVRVTEIRDLGYYTLYFLAR